MLGAGSYVWFDFGSRISTGEVLGYLVLPDWTPLWISAQVGAARGVAGRSGVTLSGSTST